MGVFQITCIVKENRQSPYERIKYVGLDGGPAKYTQQEIVGWIDNREHSFYVLRGGHRVDVITATSRYNHRYIKTVADGEEPNNLLAQPECVA